MATINRWNSMHNSNENVMRRKLLRMDTKTLIKQCKSEKVGYCGSRGDIVNRLLKIKKSKQNSSKHSKQRKSVKKKKKRTHNRVTSSIHVLQSSTEAIESVNIVITPRKKKKTTICNIKSYSRSRLQLIINGYIRMVMHNCVHFSIPDKINNICLNYSCSFVYDLNNLDFSVTINNDMINEVNKIYMKLCKYTLGTMSSFQDMRIFTFGIYNNFPQFLQYLSDCYIKKMAQKRKNPFNEESVILYLKSLKWMKNIIKMNPNVFAYFVNNLTYYIHAKTYTNTHANDMYINTHKTYGMVTRAIRTDAYFNRNINDDIYAIFYYITTVIQFINNLVLKNKNITPFQFDFCILFKQLKQVTKPTNHSQFRFDSDIYFNDQYESYDSNDNSSDNSDIDIEYDYNSFIPKIKKKKTPKLRQNKLDIIGDIKQRLQATNCSFVETNINTNFNSQENNFEEKLLSDFNQTYLNLKLQIDNKKLSSYPKNHRFIGVIDRRKWIKNEERKNENKYDELIMFEPPKSKKCNELEIENKFYNKPLPELYHNKSAQCLIPGIAFNDNNINQVTPNNELQELTGNVQETISVISNTNGAMMTLSFHIESNDQIKCYLWYGNGHLRFYPKDIQNILSCAFMLDYQSNAYFLHDSIVTKNINSLNIKDTYFEHFYQVMTQKKFKHF